MGECDVELLQRWRRGDPLAFETLVRSWQAPMARFLGRLTADRDLVPDLCQEVFLRVHRGRDGFRGDAAFGTWLYRIAMNVARDAGRRSNRKVVSLNGHELIDVGASRRRHAAERAELVVNVLASLPEPQRETLVLRHFGDFVDLRHDLLGCFVVADRKMDLDELAIEFARRVTRGRILERVRRGPGGATRRGLAREVDS